MQTNRSMGLRDLRKKWLQLERMHPGQATRVPSMRSHMVTVAMRFALHLEWKLIVPW